VAAVSLQKKRTSEHNKPVGKCRKEPGSAFLQQDKDFSFDLLKPTLRVALYSLL